MYWFIQEKTIKGCNNVVIYLLVIEYDSSLGWQEAENTHILPPDGTFISQMIIKDTAMEIY